MGHLKCFQCGLINWSDAARCKRCRALVTDAEGRPFVPTPPRFRPYLPKSEPEEPVLRDDGLAWASLMLGLGGFLFFGLSSLVGLLCGILALWRARRRPAAYGGQGYAVAGICLSFLSALCLCYAAWWVATNKMAANDTANLPAAQPKAR
jgi:hypothetical protein